MTSLDEMKALKLDVMRALVAVPGLTDVRASVSEYLAPGVYEWINVLLHRDDARALVTALDADTVDRVEVAAVVETIGELHPLVAPPRHCPTCSERTPCRTRQMLTQLPGGAT